MTVGPHVTRGMLADGVFGKGFFERLAEHTPGVWAGPVASAYSVHIVRIG